PGRESGCASCGFVELNAHGPRRAVADVDAHVHYPGNVVVHNLGQKVEEPTGVKPFLLMLHDSPQTTRYGWPRWAGTLVRCSATCGLREDSEHLQNEDQEGGPQHCHNPAHDGATRGKPKHAGQPEPQARADDAHHDVGYGAHLRVRLHEDAGQPAHDSSHNQRDDPMHALSSSAIFVTLNYWGAPASSSAVVAHIDLCHAIPSPLPHHHSPRLS